MALDKFPLFGWPQLLIHRIATYVIHLKHDMFLHINLKYDHNILLIIVRFQLSVLFFYHDKTKAYSIGVLNFEFEDLIEVALDRKKYLQQKITCEDTIFIRDHDIKYVFLWYLFGKKSRGDKFSRDFVENTFEKLILKYARSSKQTVFIENNKIFWEK